MSKVVSHSAKYSVQVSIPCIDMCRSYRCSDTFYPSGHTVRRLAPCPVCGGCLRHHFLMYHICVYISFLILHRKYILQEPSFLDICADYFQCSCNTARFLSHLFLMTHNDVCDLFTFLLYYFITMQSDLFILTICLYYIHTATVIYQNKVGFKY